MAITSAVCDSAKQQFLSGSHTPNNLYKIALYTSAASLDHTTTGYTTSNEVSAGGTGYTAGGQQLLGWSSSINLGVACLTFTTNPSWTNSNISAAGALIYNTSGSSSLCVISFGGTYTATSGTFSVTFPACTSGSALLQIN